MKVSRSHAAASVRPCEMQMISTFCLSQVTEYLNSQESAKTARVSPPPLAEPLPPLSSPSGFPRRLSPRSSKHITALMRLLQPPLRFQLRLPTLAAALAPHGALPPVWVGVGVGGGASRKDRKAFSQSHCSPLELSDGGGLYRWAPSILPVTSAN